MKRTPHMIASLTVAGLFLSGAMVSPLFAQTELPTDSSTDNPTEGSVDGSIDGFVPAPENPLEDPVQNKANGFPTEQSCDDSDDVSQSYSADGSTDEAVVATPDPYASDIACRTLLDGGSAADAVAAAQFTMGLTEPQSSGPGGGGIAVYYDADSDETKTWNASAPAPEDVTSSTKSGVPQTTKLINTLHDDYGDMDLDEVVDPIADLADDGFTVSKRMNSAINRRIGDMSEIPWPEVSSDDIPDEGDEVTNPDDADYLRDLDISGDLEPEDPLCVDYRENEVCGSSDAGTGMMIVGEALGILDNLDQDMVTDNTKHVVTEAERLALANGNTWMQDPDIDPELSEAYVDELVTNQEHLEEQADRIEGLTPVWWTP